MAAATICSAFGAPQNKVCHCFHCFPIHFVWIYSIPYQLYFLPWSHVVLAVGLRCGWACNGSDFFLHWHLLRDSRENTDQEKRSICSGQRWLAGQIPQWKHPFWLGQPPLSQQRDTVSPDISCITFPFWELVTIVFSKGAIWKLSSCLLNAVWYFPKRMPSPLLTIFVCFLIICLLYFLATPVDLPFCYSR